jgi:cell division transport system permease protein
MNRQGPLRRADERDVMVDLGHERPQVPPKARNASPIVPRASISGRALVAVVAIMTFLASMTTGVVLLISASAAEWQSEVSSELTVQVRSLRGRDLDRDADRVAEVVRSQPGVVEVRIFTKDESAPRHRGRFAHEKHRRPSRRGRWRRMPRVHARMMATAEPQRGADAIGSQLNFRI